MPNPGQKSPDNETLRDLNKNLVSLSESLEKATKNSEKYSDAMLGFSLVLLLVAVLQLFVTVQSLNHPFWLEVILILANACIVFFALTKIFGWLEEKYKK